MDTKIIIQLSLKETKKKENILWIEIFLDHLPDSFYIGKKYIPLFKGNRKLLEYYLRDLDADEEIKHEYIKQAITLFAPLIVSSDSVTKPVLMGFYKQYNTSIRVSDEYKGKHKTYVKKQE